MGSQVDASETAAKEGLDIGLSLHIAFSTLMVKWRHKFWVLMLVSVALAPVLARRDGPAGTPRAGPMLASQLLSEW